jgi:hypothetical protein
MLVDAGVDIVNVADGPRATARMSNLAFCALLLEAPRHRAAPPRVRPRPEPAFGQMAHLLGAHALGIRNLVVITGDPPKVGDYPEATAVYDLDSVGLLQMASSRMNRGIDPAGQARARRPDRAFCCATGVEPGAAGPRASELRAPRGEGGGRGRARDDPAGVPAGAARRGARAHRAPRGSRCWSASCRSSSYKNAEFLHNEVPGMQHPRGDPRADATACRRRRGGPAARAMQIAREMLFAVRDRVQGAYLMPPLGSLRARARGPRRLKR